MMKINPVEGSSRITGEAYDPQTEVLRIRFRDGAQYDYHGVTSEIYQTFMEAPSRGSYLEQVIVPVAPATRLKEDSNAGTQG